VFFLSIVEEKQEQEDSVREETREPSIVPKREAKDESATPQVEATPSASVPPESVPSFTCENTPDFDYPPAKRKRGRPAKNRPPVTYTEPSTPGSVAAEPPARVVPPPALPSLMADGDENVPVELDAAGESKVTRSGELSGGREYALKIFRVVGHGDKLFMLATEVARLTGYRDSYLFFLRNRNLRKVVTTQTEKEGLISDGVIPYSFRSRQISVVTARSVFIQFGYRVILNGQRVRDDYYEERARKDHSTELHIMEGRELRHQAAVAAATAAMASSNTHNAHPSAPAPVAIASSVAQSDVPRPREWHPLPKAKPPIFGAPWHEQYQPLTSALIVEKATAVMRYNTLIAGERNQRAKMWKDWWTPASARVKDEPPPQPEGTLAPGWTGGYHG
jgi:hypothetical protein